MVRVFRGKIVSRTPHIPLHATLDRDGAFDGTFVRVATGWWNRLLGSDKEYAESGFPPFDAERLEAAQAIVNPANQALFKEVGRWLDPAVGDVAVAGVGLAYSLAIVFETGATIDAWNDRGSDGWRTGRAVSVGEIVEIDTAYSTNATMSDWFGYQATERYWDFWLQGTDNRSALVGLAARAAIWSYRKQLIAWGMKIRKRPGVLTDGRGEIVDPAGAFMLGLDDQAKTLFEWGGRLRLWERS